MLICLFLCSFSNNVKNASIQVDKVTIFYSKNCISRINFTGVPIDGTPALCCCDSVKIECPRTRFFTLPAVDPEVAAELLPVPPLVPLLPPPLVPQRRFSD